MRLYQPKKGDSPIIAVIYGQHQKFKVVRESSHRGLSYITGLTMSPILASFKTYESP
jgi:hypothetical protein